MDKSGGFSHKEVRQNKRIWTPQTIMSAPTSNSNTLSGQSVNTANKPVVKIMRDDLQSLSVEDMRLLNDQFGFVNGNLSKVLTTNSDFAVVGVIGTQGVGKSGLLNQIFGLSDGADATVPVSSFKTGAGDLLSRCKHTTTAVDVRVSSLERVLVLDSPAVMSPSMLHNLLLHTRDNQQDNRALHHPACQDDGSCDRYLEVIALQLAVFLLSVCSVVLVVSSSLQVPSSP